MEMRKGKKVSNIAISLLLIGSGLTMFTVFADNVLAQQLTVNDQGGAMFTSITEAINAAVPNDIIRVEFGSGTYTENIVINKPLSIIGLTDPVSGNRPTISAQNSGSHTVTISSSPVTIENFIITGSTFNAGIYSNVVAQPDNKVNILGCDINNNYYGIYLNSDSMYHYVYDCDIHDNVDGIELRGTYHYIYMCGPSYQANTGIYDNGYGIVGVNLYYSMIEDSNIYSNTHYGIWLNNADYNTFDELEIWQNGDGGIYLVGDGNSFDGRDTRYIKDNNYGSTSGAENDVEILGHENTISNYYITRQSGDREDRIGLYLYGGINGAVNTIEDCRVSGYEDDYCVGIQLGSYCHIVGQDTYIHSNMMGVKITGSNTLIDCDNSDIHTNVNFYNNQYNMRIEGGNARIYDINISHGGESSGDIGIIVDNSGYYEGYASISNIKVYNLERAIYLIESDYSEHNTIYGVTLEKNDYGIYMYQASYNDFDYIFVNHSKVNGIYAWNSDYNTISYGIFRNNLYDNDHSGAGIHLNYSCTENEIEYCDFIRHYKGVWIDDESPNNPVSHCDFSDYDTTLGNGVWGSGEEVIGIYVTNYCPGQTFTDNNFDDISYCFGIEGCWYINIQGDTQNPSTISGTVLSAIYATTFNNDNSSGCIAYYSSSVSTTYVTLKGLSDNYKTEFNYAHLSGTWGVRDSIYYTWQDTTPP